MRNPHLRFIGAIKHYFLALLILLVSSAALAQQVVNGIVKDNTTPLAGATVGVKGTNVYTQTGTNGTFSITVPQGRTTLVISFINFETQEVDVASMTNVDVTLAVSKNTMDEVYVTGYTSQKKKEITGAVSVIKPTDMTKVAAPSFLGQIEGRASGIQTTSSGQPGSGISLRIRGNSTFTEGGGDPLLVVDGVQLKGAFQNTINPNDIESIQILKDAGTTAAYGIGANNGVIIITTKKGKSGPPKVDYNSYYGVQSAVNGYDKMLIKTSAEYMQLVYQSIENSGPGGSGGWAALPNDAFEKRLYGNGAQPVLPQYINPVRANATITNFDVGAYNFPNNLVMRASPGTDWWDAIMRNASIQEHNVSVSGGGEKGGRYFMSANYFDQDGIVSYTKFKRYTVRANTEFKVKGITFGENMAVAFTNGVDMPDGNQVEQNQLNQGLLKMQPIIPVYDEGGNYGGTKAGFGNGKNGVAELYRNKDNKRQIFRMLGNVYAEVKFLNHFTGRISYGADYGTEATNSFTFVDEESNEKRGSTTWREAFNRSYRWIATEQVTYDNEFGQDHSLRVTGVHEAQLNSFRNLRGRLDNYLSSNNQAIWYLNAAFADPATREVVSSGGKNQAKESWLGRVEYGYKGKYLINGSARYDQSSNFAEDKGQLFGGVGVAWRLSDEAFLQNITWVNELKLRGSWGITGNDAIDPNSNYTFYGGGPGQTFYAIDGSNTSVATGFSLTSTGHPVLWEKQKQFDIGVDAVLFKNKLELSMEYYKRINKDFLFRPDQPATFGALGGAVATSFENIGSISNKGFEFSGVWRSSINTDWRYDVGVNLTFNKNRIDELAPKLGITSFYPQIVESRIGALVRNFEGAGMSTFYGFVLDGIYQSAAEVNDGIDQPGKAIGRFRFKDINGDKVVNDDDKTIIGDPNPNLVYGVNLNVGYKNFDLTVFLQGTQGNDIFNYTKYFTDFFGFSGNRARRMLYESWTPTRTNARLPLLDKNNTASQVPSTYYVEDGSYLRCKTLQLGYRLPSSLMSRVGISNARIYVQAQNLFTVTKYEGLDPTLGSRGSNTRGNEQPQTEQWFGIDYGNYPTARILSVGLNVGF